MSGALESRPPADAWCWTRSWCGIGTIGVWRGPRERRPSTSSSAATASSGSHPAACTPPPLRSWSARRNGSRQRGARWLPRTSMARSPTRTTCTACRARRSCCCRDCGPPAATGPTSRSGTRSARSSVARWTTSPRPSSSASARVAMRRSTSTRRRLRRRRPMPSGRWRRLIARCDRRWRWSPTGRSGPTGGRAHRRRSAPSAAR